MPTTCPIKRKEIQKRYRLKHKEKIKEYYYNIVKVRNNTPEYRATKALKIKLKRKLNPEKHRLNEKNYYYKNREKILEQKRILSKKRRDKNRLYENNRYNNDIEFKLRKVLRNRIKKVLTKNKKIGSHIKSLGCTIQELKQYLESQFKPGMTWENYGFGNNKWSLDHIIPLSSFNLINIDEFNKACHYTNLQPMWCLENFSKGAKIDVKYNNNNI